VIVVKCGETGRLTSAEDSRRSLRDCLSGFPMPFLSSHSVCVGYVVCVVVAFKSLFSICDLIPSFGHTVCLVAAYVWHTTYNFGQTVVSFYFQPDHTLVCLKSLWSYDLLQPSFHFVAVTVIAEDLYVFWVNRNLISWPWHDGWSHRMRKIASPFHLLHEAEFCLVLHLVLTKLFFQSLISWQSEPCKFKHRTLLGFSSFTTCLEGP
jgi:hypothetical protein